MIYERIYKQGSVFNNNYLKTIRQGIIFFHSFHRCLLTLYAMCWLLPAWLIGEIKELEWSPVLILVLPIFFFFFFFTVLRDFLLLVGFYVQGSENITKNVSTFCKRRLMSKETKIVIKEIVRARNVWLWENLSLSLSLSLSSPLYICMMYILLSIYLSVS